MSTAPCEICGSASWTVSYTGPVRDGTFGRIIEEATVRRCGGCGVERLDERFCLTDADYQSDAYRSTLGQELDNRSYKLKHDTLQRFTMSLLAMEKLRDMTLADIGCGGGSLLDHLRGITAGLLGVEPYDRYRETLTGQGYVAYPYASDAARDHAGTVDLAVSQLVIEHTADPRSFLQDIHSLLKPGGRLLISTPNADDILLDLLPDTYPAFFYRRVHRWYFNADSLARCAAEAGFTVDAVHHVHRYPLSNALTWLRDRKPAGDIRLPGIDSLADGFWTAYLERAGRSDCVYLMLRKP
ncbi:class I SAM-dependent methyltransferase [Niveispirillum irakense]|uniref:class I SAM-dependent methyltransferase n=1 Tax=Niveispirillum irakense TaxID=34011 RepID=UPI000A034B3A|nr:class I SAM-dependent methyltransferase [Niveispirillum irakense]